MSFLKHQKEIPDFLIFYLKYTRFIECASPSTTEELYSDLKLFFRYIKLTKDNKTITREILKNVNIMDITLNDIRDITKQDIENYLYFLKYEFNNSPKTRNRKLASLKNFFKYLYTNNYISINPTEFIKMVQTEKRLPKYLNLDESKKLLSKTISSNERNKIRNYAIICLFLNCCLRLSELVKINITDIKFDDKTLKVRGKGNTERIIYLNDAVIESLNSYINVRTNLEITNADYNALFLSERKKRISKRTIQLIVENELKKTFDKEKKEIHTHSLRHTGASLLYNEENINILIIQKILGHKLLTSTEIYTHISNKKLKGIMENYAISSILEKMEETKNGKI